MLSFQAVASTIPLLTKGDELRRKAATTEKQERLRKALLDKQRKLASNVVAERSAAEKAWKKRQADRIKDLKKQHKEQKEAILAGLEFYNGSLGENNSKYGGAKFTFSPMLLERKAGTEVRNYIETSPSRRGRDPRLDPRPHAYQMVRSPSREASHSPSPSRSASPTVTRDPQER